MSVAGVPPTVEDYGAADVEPEEEMDNVAMLQRAVGETSRLLESITPDQLANSTMCTEWTVRDLINHVTGGATMFAISAEQGSVPDELVGQLMGGDNLGDDYKGSWAVASKRALAAFDDPGALDMGKQMIGPELRQPGVFDNEQNVASSASAEDRLLAFAGRRI